MPERILDTCALLNLFTGWGGLSELAGMGGSWYLAHSVSKESEYYREYDSEGDIHMLPLDINPFIETGQLSMLTVQSDQELQDYVDFATELDDGEAESMALAKNRGLVLVTDDIKAVKIAGSLEVPVMTLSTPSLLREWSQQDRINPEQIGNVINRIRYLARFQPPPGSPDRSWWDSWTHN